MDKNQHSKNPSHHNVFGTVENLSKNSLVENSEIFRLLVDSTIDYAIFALNRDGSIKTWNKGAERLKGYTSSEIIGKHFSAFYTTTDIERKHPQYELEIATAEGRYEEEGWRVRKDGSQFWAQITLTKLTNAEGKHIGFAKVTHDLSERRAHQEQLKDSEEKLRLMIESVKDYAIFMLDPTGHVSSWNEGARAIKQYEKNEIIGKHFREFYPTHVQKALFPEYELEVASREGRIEDVGWRVKKDGSQFWASVVISSIRNSAGDLLGFTKVTRDLTSQKLAEENIKEYQANLERTVEERTKELTQSKIAAENASRSKSTFLANMSHEIRTPLGVIKGFTDLITKNDLSQEKINSYMSIIQRNSSQLLTIIDDILDISKVEAGRMSIENIPFSLTEVLADISSTLELRAKENSISFEFIATTPIPSSVRSDPTRLRQILINIVGNAIKFTDKGYVRILASYDDGILKFMVEDSGIGISQEQAKKIFEPFTQANLATNRKFGGTGLGLALTQNLCQSMGGDFYLSNSELGKGSTFVAKIRVETSQGVPFTTNLSDPLPVETSSNNQISKPLDGMSVLLVEDSQDNQRLIQILLSQVGANVDLASDGKEGAEKALAGNYDVVLMDIQMPIVDGFQALKLLLAKRYSKPIIALTAHAMKEYREQALNAGFTNYLSKPVDQKSLVDALKKIYVQRT